MVTETHAENVVRFKGWMVAEEAADYLGVGRDYIYRLKGVYEHGGAGIPGFRLGDSGRALMFRIADLDAYKSAHPNLGKLRAGTPDDPEDDDEAEDDAEAETDEEEDTEDEPEPAPAPGPAS